jgi:two-component system OmpR family sensor kinase
VSSRPGWRLGLAARAALAMTAVAAVAVLLAGLVSLQLVRGAAEAQSLSALKRQAEVVSSLTDRSAGAGPGPQQRARFLRLIRLQRVSVGMVTPAGKATGPTAAALRPADLTALQADRAVSGVRRAAGRRVLLAGQPFESGGALVLMQPATVARSVVEDVLRRTLLALLVGLVGAAAAGTLLARRLAAPLQRAAAAAHQMASGARDVRLPAGGPAEVAEVAVALNTLAGALTTSESRQREFLLSISHELRTPLTAVKGYAEAIADGVVPAGELPATGRTMLAEATRLERLVSDLLDLARLGAQDFRVDPRPVDLVELVREAGRVWAARSSREGVDLLVEVAPVSLVAVTDGTRVRQILDGLAENALRVTPAGAVIVLAARRDGGSAVLQVRDGGPGLTPEDLSVAFERSALYDRYRGVRRVGTGLGLALVAGLAARLGGTASAGTAPEGGAAFTITLPLAPDPAAAGRGASAGRVADPVPTPAVTPAGGASTGAG